MLSGPPHCCDERRRRDSAARLSLAHVVEMRHANHYCSSLARRKFCVRFARSSRHDDPLAAHIVRAAPPDSHLFAPSPLTRLMRPPLITLLITLLASPIALLAQGAPLPKLDSIFTAQQGTDRPGCA